jgi:hypothetical protein
MKKMNRWALGSLLTLALFLILGGPEAKAQTKPALGVRPFFVERGTDCPICKDLFHKGDVLPSGPKTLNRLLQQKTETLGEFKVIPFEKVEAALSQWDRKKAEERRIPAFVQLGKELDADYLFTGFLFRYEERIGSAVGVDKAASVGFDLHLFRIRDGLDVWRGKMDETQRPLSENLFKIGSFVRRRGSWLTVEELATVGMEEIFKNFPSVQELEAKR